MLDCYIFHKGSAYSAQRKRYLAGLCCLLAMFLVLVLPIGHP